MSDKRAWSADELKTAVQMNEHVRAQLARRQRIQNIAIIVCVLGVTLIVTLLCSPFMTFHS